MNAMNFDPAASLAADILSYGTSPCTLGEVLAARSTEGVCAVLIGDTVEELEADLAALFPGSAILRNELSVQEDLAKLVRFMEKPAAGLHLTIDMRGTPFQRRVWQKLRTIPVGRTVTYSELAKRIGPPASPRAIGSACAANPVAIAIPCHRVVRSDGGFAGYRWGIERKRALIRKEATAWR